MTVRPRRSVLYMPGSNARALEKARELPADGLILDLEDAVAPEAKAQARGAIVNALYQGGYGDREVMVRINGLDTRWWVEDLTIIAAAKPDAVLVPKISNPGQLQDLAARIVDMGTDPSVRVWAMMETPLAMLNVGEIAAAALDSETRLSGFVMGTNDLAKDTRARLVPGRAPMLPWLMNCIAAARAYGLDILDGVYNDLGDAEGFAAECLQARDLGFILPLRTGLVAAGERAVAPDHIAELRDMSDAIDGVGAQHADLRIGQAEHRPRFSGQVDAEACGRSPNAARGIGRRIEAGDETARRERPGGVLLLVQSIEPRKVERGIDRVRAGHQAVRSVLQRRECAARRAVDDQKGFASGTVGLQLRNQAEVGLAGHGKQTEGRHGVQKVHAGHHRGGCGGAAVAVRCQTHDVGLLAAVGEEVADRIAEIKAWIEAAELQLEIRPAAQQNRTVGRPLSGPADKGGDAGRCTGYGMSAARGQSSSLLRKAPAEASHEYHSGYSADTRS